jgi:hypothetical protein
MDHLGISFADINQHLNDSLAKPTRQSLSSASRRFRRSSESEKEFWAQAMTWVTLQKLPTPERASFVFLELMKHQRTAYQLEWDLLTILTPLSLQKVREMWTNRNLPAPPKEVTAREALTALLRAMEAKELNQVVKLRSSLAKLNAAIGASTVPTPHGKPTNSELLIARNGPLQVRINAETSTHRRPHFHILHKAGYSASYAIRDCELLAGSMPAKYEKLVCQWAQEHHSDLLQAWNDVNNGKVPRPLVLVV